MEDKTHNEQILSQSNW